MTSADSLLAARSWETVAMTTKHLKTRASGHIHPESGIVQVGWLGHADSRVYDLTERPADFERGGFSPLYAPWGDECGHMIREREAQV